MAYSIQLPGKEIPKVTGESNNPIEFISAPVARATARGIETTLGLPGSLYEGIQGAGNYLINKATGYENVIPENHILPTISSVRKNITSKIYEPKIMEPGRNVVERFFDRIGPDIPLILGSAFTGGASLAPILARSAGANLTSQTIEEAGGGPVAQFFGGLAGGIGGNFLQSRFANATQGLTQAGKATGKGALGTSPSPLAAQNIEKHLRIKQKDLYQEVKKFAENKFIPATQEKDKISSLLNKLDSGSSGLKNSIRKEVRRELEAVEEAFGQNPENYKNITEALPGFHGQAKDSINLNKAIDQVQHLNSIIRDETNTSAQRYYQQAVKGLQGAISKAEEQFTDWGKLHKEAKNITTVLSTADEAEKRLKDISDVLSNGGLKTLFKTPKWLFGDFVPSKEIRYLFELPEARKYFGNVVKGVLKDDLSFAERNLRGLDKIANSYKKPQKYSIQLPG